MKAKIEKRDMTLSLELSEEEFRLILGGIGKTSISSRMKAGMLREEAYVIDHLYAALRMAYTDGGDA